MFYIFSKGLPIWHCGAAEPDSIQGSWFIQGDLWGGHAAVTGPNLLIYFLKVFYISPYNAAICSFIMNNIQSVVIICLCETNRSWNQSSSVMPTNWRSCEQMVSWRLPHRCHTSTLCLTTSCLRSSQGLTQSSRCPSSQVCYIAPC